MYTYIIQLRFNFKATTNLFILLIPKFCTKRHICFLFTCVNLREKKMNDNL